MRLSPSSACVLTAIATAASVYITRSITNESVSQINPLFAAIGGFATPAYAINILNKSRTKPKNPQKLVTMFVVLGICAIAFIPTALKATKSDDL